MPTGSSTKAARSSGIRTGRASAVNVTCASEVFIATALLHREHPRRADFAIQEIVARAAKENVYGRLRSGVQVHASHHCVANRAPNPLAHCMLYATGKHTRRLVCASDDVHPDRNDKHWPDPSEIPERYAELIEWARKRYQSGATRSAAAHPLLKLDGLGSYLWRDTDPDAYVRQLREGWE